MSNRFNIKITEAPKERKNGRDPSVDIESNIHQAMYPQPSYTDRHHISGITTKLGFLNDPDIADPLIHRQTRRNRARVNYQTIEENENQSMLYKQEVHFFDGNDDNNNNGHSHNHNIGGGGVGSNYNNDRKKKKNADRNNGNNNIKTHYKNQDENDVEIPIEERGNNVTIGGLNMSHGSIVRLNYNQRNATYDARVVSVKKNQLSAVTLVSNKRKRIWYKELREGKINIVPATAYR